MCLRPIILTHRQHPTASYRGHHYGFQTMPSCAYPPLPLTLQWCHISAAGDYKCLYPASTGYSSCSCLCSCFGYFLFFHSCLCSTLDTAQTFFALLFGLLLPLLLLHWLVLIVFRPTIGCLKILCLLKTCVKFFYPNNFLPLILQNNPTTKTCPKYIQHWVLYVLIFFMLKICFWAKLNGNR